MKDIKFDYALESPSIYENFPKNILERIVSSDKKILILDLDETLIHTDFEEEFEDDEYNKYDAKISFYSEDKGNGLNRNCKLGKEENDNEAEITDEESKDDSKEKVLNTVGIFLRPGVRKFLEEVSESFEVGIFTASVPEYANAVIKYLDPENKFIKFRLYRNNCVNVGDLLRVKNLNIIKNIPLKKVVLVDNNIYSFTAQLNNGILINSFYTDKNDNELSNVLSYLNNYILPADDVREVNENFFGFKKIVDDIISNSV
jgi:Dullard-like phosphatase family protein